MLQVSAGELDLLRRFVPPLKDSNEPLQFLTHTLATIKIALKIDRNDIALHRDYITDNINIWHARGALPLFTRNEIEDNVYRTEGPKRIIEKLDEILNQPEIQVSNTMFEAGRRVQRKYDKKPGNTGIDYASIFRAMYAQMQKEQSFSQVLRTSVDPGSYIHRRKEDVFPTETQWRYHSRVRDTYHGARGHRRLNDDKFLFHVRKTDK